MMLKAGIPCRSWAEGGAYHESADYTVEIEAPPDYRIAAGAAADTLSRSETKNRYRFTLTNANGFAWIADTGFPRNCRQHANGFRPARFILDIFITRGQPSIPQTAGRNQG